MMTKFWFQILSGKLAPIRRDRAGFTLLELVVVLAIVCLGALVLVPARAGVKTNSPTLQCLNNLRQLEAAAAMYAGDYGGNMPPNGRYFEPTWVPGFEDWNAGGGDGSGPNTNVFYMLSGALGPYARTAAIYKCPADTVPSRIGPRVRTYAMNAFVGGRTEWDVYGYTAYRNFYTTSDLATRGAAQTFVFLDEHPNSIFDGAFATRMPPVGSWPGPAAWLDLPASYHGDAGCLSFADGHVEAHRWVDASTRLPVTQGLALGSLGASPNDTRWLVTRASAPN